MLNVPDDIDQSRGQTITDEELAKKFGGDVQVKTMNMDKGEY